MYRIFKFIPTILFCVALTVRFAEAKEDQMYPNLQSQRVVDGNNAFGIGLYHVMDGGNGNLFFSPYGISTALSMAYAGSRGNTEAEMKTVLQVRLDQKTLHPAFRDLNRELMDDARKTGQRLDIADALVLTGGDVTGAYKDLLKRDYAAEIFTGGLKQINDWVDRKTEGKIEKILEKLDPNSVCVILNAIYFKGIWENKFPVNNTKDAPFMLTAKDRISVPFMHQRSRFKILGASGFRAISIPYKNGSLSMVILLPASVDGLVSVEKSMTDQTIKEWLSQLDLQPEQTADLYLPKFRLETKYNLVPPLTTMGIKDAFSMDNADFTGMGGEKGDLHISQVVHKAYIKVNEEGTEAAAATAVEMAGKSIPVFEYPVFRADHPFFFLIRDNRSGTFLFMGRIMNPEKE